MSKHQLVCTTQCKVSTSINSLGLATAAVPVYFTRCGDTSWHGGKTCPLGNLRGDA